MKLSQKLAMGMGVLILLMAFGVGFAIMQLTTISTNVTELDDKSIPGLMAMLQIDTIASDETLEIMRHVYSTNAQQIKTYDDKILALQVRLAERQKIFAASIMNDETAKLWTDYQEISSETGSLREQALELSRVYKDKEAMAVLDGPYLASYTKKSGAITKLVGATIALTNAETTHAIDATKSGIQMLVGLLLVAIVISIIITVFLIRSVLAQLGGDPGVLAEVALKVTKGDYSIDDGKPRTGVYGNIVNMVDALKENISKAQEQSRLAQVESDRAKAAMASAESSSKEAQAKTQTMLTAALQLEEVANIVSSASAELAAQIEQSERGAMEQASRVAETATAMEEMNSTVLEVARSAGTASDVSMNTRNKAEAGARVVLSAVKSIQEVRTQALKLKSDMHMLDEHARNISQIMSVISDIADQTNLLALNAAIEAARAGEAGRGFAVVADEVRKLAEKTMASTTDVGNAIRAIQQSATESMVQVDTSATAIEDATNFANQSGEALSEIVHMVDNTADQVRAIATASEEQSATSEEINRSISHVNTIAAETSRAMSEAASAVSELSQQAQVLTHLIDEMKRS